MSENFSDIARDNRAEIKVIKNQMQSLNDKFDNFTTENKIQHKEMLEMFQCAMDKKAGKWTEKVLVGVGSVIGTALILAILSIILQ